MRPRSRILRGHDWVYASEVLKTFGAPTPGEVISLKDGKDRLLGSAVYNPSSQIVARRFSRRREVLNPEFFRRRLSRALEWRRKNGCHEELCRLLWSEADGVPGVVADRYGPVVVLQINSLGMELHLAEITDVVSELPGVDCVVERNDAPVRAAEKLPPRAGVLRGELPQELIVEAAGAKFGLDLLGGQKTGLYLDQRENWAFVAAHARGCRVLDVFSHQGGFALACAVSGAAEVTAVESSALAAEKIKANARLNGVEVSVACEEAFEFLRRAREQRYDLVILDPPSFTHARGKLKEALLGYRELHRLAAPLLAPGGLLATFCCSHHVSAAEFQQAVSEGLADARRSANLLARLGQPPDHPIALHIPESEYLKGLLLASTAAF